jgi:aryl-alcohol dehydrogenase-like predicted oxidoreductase
MERKALGQGGVEITRLGLGGLQFGYTADEGASFAVMDAYVKAGGNFLDTANIYSRWASGHSGGESETVIGRWLASRGKRHDLVIATKVRGEMWHRPDGQGLGRDHIMRACEDSLRRLQVETIDLYQCHWPDQKTPIQETLRAFEELISAGKVREIGVSNFGSSELREALSVAKAGGLPEFVSVQPHYNLAWRQEFEDGLADLCREEGLAVLVYSPLAAGFLTGKYTRQQAAKSKRASGVKKYYTERGWATVEALRAIADVRGVACSTVAIAWLLSREDVTAPILGANTVEQLTEALAGANLALSAEEMAMLATVSDWRE